MTIDDFMPLSDAQVQMLSFELELELQQAVNKLLEDNKGLIPTTAEGNKILERVFADAYIKVCQRYNITP